MTLLLTLFLPDGRMGPGIATERRPGVFEIRIAVGVDPVSGRTVQRSFWFHGALEDAAERRSELATQFAEYRAFRRAAPFLTVGELVERWMAAHHDWRPSTWSSARSNVKALTADPVAERRVSSLRPEVVRQAMARWKETGASVSVLSGRFRVLRSSVGWAQSESIIERNPIRDMRGPPRPGTRMHVPVGDVATLIEASETLVEKAEAALDGSTGSLHALHKADRFNCLSGWLSTPAPDGGSWLPSASATWTAECSPSSGGSQGKRLAPPKPGRCAG